MLSCGDGPAHNALMAEISIMKKTIRNFLRISLSIFNELVHNFSTCRQKVKCHKVGGSFGTSLLTAQ